MKQDSTIVPYAPVIIKLLQGIVYQDDTTYWGILLKYQSSIRDYFGKIGVRVYLEEAEGYAYLQQPDDNGEEEPQAQSLPRLVVRRGLSYGVTLLCVVLREELQQFDTSNSDSTRCICSKEQIYNLMRPFFKEKANDVQLVKKFDGFIDKAVDLEFLKPLKGGKEDSRYEIRRILKAKIPADKLVEIKERLEAYVQSNAGI